MPVQSSDENLSIAELKNTFNQQTSKISWEELQRFYASGAVIGVDTKADLIDVACQFHLDNKDRVQQWLADNTVFKVDDSQASVWFDNKSSHWAVVVAPWVLVQEISLEK